MRNLVPNLIVLGINIVSVPSPIRLEHLQKYFEVLKVVLVLVRDHTLNIHHPSVQVADHQQQLV